MQFIGKQQSNSIMPNLYCVSRIICSHDPHLFDVFSLSLRIQSVKPAIQLHSHWESLNIHPIWSQSDVCRLTNPFPSLPHSLRFVFPLLSSATLPLSSVSSYNHPRLFNTLSSFPSPLTLHPFLRGRALKGITFPDILCLPLTPTPATTNAATPLHHPPPTSHMLYRISSRRTKVVEDISLLSAKLVGFKCCFAELSLLVSEQIPNVACFKLCPSGGFVSGNRLMTFWH